jgi:hypothetical protein
MTSYITTTTRSPHFKKIVTLLNYEDKISDVLRSINLPSLSGSTILVDTALVAGINQYRFIAAKVHSDGHINLNQYSYVDVDIDLLNLANNIIKSHPNKLNSSILTTSQINQINQINSLSLSPI